jgi:hypothetical protein
MNYTVKAIFNNGEKQTQKGNATAYNLYLFEVDGRVSYLDFNDDMRHIQKGSLLKGYTVVQNQQWLNLKKDPQASVEDNSVNTVKEEVGITDVLKRIEEKLDILLNER